ncbi:MAG: hypothetical protein LBR15_03845 [Methanobrevibacter sp.]|jgi:outer membrane murein-binding lipoprotein Lpp|nr:hypothetical protein [Candidatus Methanovirga australis]
MKNKIIVISVLVLVIAISGCVNSDMENINQIIPKLNDNIKSGDSNFNLAVDGLNANKANVAETRVKTAIEKFNNAKINIDDMRKNYKNLNNTKYINYIDLISEELDYKINASLALQSAIRTPSSDKQLFNEYVSYANSWMLKGFYIQDERNSLVLNNPNLFN